jgi:6-phosphogluconolactonase
MDDRSADSNEPNEQLVYIGTYTEQLPHVRGRAAEGIYVYRMDRDTGTLRLQSTASGAANPSFVTLDAERRCLYSVQEISEYAGQAGGGASAFAIDRTTGDLQLIGSQPTHGAHPCYVGIDASGRWLLVANYSGGNVCVLPIAGDGAIGPASAVVAHDGPHPHHDGPHPHAFVAAPGGRLVLVPDCGLDRLYVYRLDRGTGTLVPHDVPWATLAPGAGPRHLAWNAAGDIVYCINERNSTLTVFAFDAESGTLRELQTLSTLPDGFDGSNSCADVHVHPSGRFVYGSNRGHNSIVAFAVDENTGTLRLLGHCSTEGRTPRNFGIDPSGAFLLAANQDSGTVATFTIDQSQGIPRFTGQITEVPSPVCVCFA